MTTTDPRPVEPTAPVRDICCGRRLRRVEIQAPGSALTFTFCGGCERMQWFADGMPVDRDHATAVAGTVPSRRSSAIR